MKSFRLIRIAALAGAAVWLVMSLLSLTRYPPMHADEAWLASQTRSILQESSLKATAGFFHITDRSPHAIRLLFHALQAPFIAASWSLTAVRLFSLLCALAGIIFALTIGQRVFKRSTAISFFAMGLAFDPLYVVSSHFARPEIVLCAALVGGSALYTRRKTKSLSCEIIVGTVIGLSAGVHANSLLVAMGIGALYVVDLIFGPDRKIALCRLSVLIGVTALWAGAWVGASRLLSPDFPVAYTEFGARYGVSDSMLVKALRFPAFYGRLFDRITGTYYLPPLRITLLLFACAATAGIVLMVMRLAMRRYDAASAIFRPFAMFVGLNLGLLLIGKYSQPSAVLLLPAGYWLVAAVMEDLGNRIAVSGDIGLAQPAAGVTGGAQTAAGGSQRAGWTTSMCRAVAIRVVPAAAVILVAAIGTVTVRDALPWRTVRYDRYLQRITSHVPAGSSVLASPNTAFAFEHGRLHAFNDLDAIDEKGMTFSGYMAAFTIEYILYPDELDLIYAERPLWNDMYGNVASYYRQMNDFLAQNCEIVAVYREPVFAMRILAYQERYDSALTIYRVINTVR